MDTEDPQRDLLDPTIKSTENFLRVVSETQSVKKEWGVSFWPLQEALPSYAGWKTSPNYVLVFSPLQPI